MVEFLSVPVDDNRARALLGEYFSYRAAGFPPEQGEYHVASPDEGRFAPPNGVFLLALVDGEAVGCGGIRRLPEKAADDGAGSVRYEVKHLWVRSAARGSGAGRALLAELERRAVQNGADEIVLDTHRSLTAAGRLYRSSGYQAITPYNDNPNATDWLGKRLGDGSATQTG